MRLGVFRIPLGILAMLLCLSLYGQNVENELSGFTGVESKGDIPKDFSIDWHEKTEESLKEFDLKSKSRRERKNLKSFWATSHHTINTLLLSGAVSFGDPATEYLNDIKDEVLADDSELRDEIRIYLLKSPIVNAFSTQQGTIFITTGLIARAKTEADLAFVICHEIIHYRDGHPLNSFLGRDSVMKGNGGTFNDMYILEKAEYLLQRSQGDEFIADSEGLLIFKDAGYNMDGVHGTFDILNRVDLPFEEQKVSTKFLDTETLQVPIAFFKAELDSIKIEEDYFDDTHTHPNIHRRREKFEEEGTLNTQGEQSHFKVRTEEEFTAIRELCRFETILQELENGYYGDALYHSNTLKARYPDNKFLDVSFAKALYGLATFKASDNYPLVGRTYNKIQGEAQQIHYLMRQLHGDQLIVIALQHIREVKKKYPELVYLDRYSNELLKLMMVECKVNFEEARFKKNAPGKYRKSVEDFETERKYLRAFQNYHREFHEPTLNKVMDSEWFKDNLEQQQHLRDSIVSEYELSARYRRRREKRKRRNYRKNGTGLGVKELVVMDPYFEDYSADLIRDHHELLKFERKYQNIISQTSAEVGVKVRELYDENIQEFDASEFNLYANIKTCLSDIRWFRTQELLPLSIEQYYTENEDELKFVCLTGFVKQRGWLNNYYYFTLVDIKKGDIVYERRNKISWFKKWRLKKNLRKDLELIKN